MEHYNLSKDAVMALIGMDRIPDGGTLKAVLKGNVFKDIEVFDNNENGVFVTGVGVIENYPSVTIDVNETHHDGTPLVYSAALAHNVQITFDGSYLKGFCEYVQNNPSEPFDITIKTNAVQRDFTGYESVDIEFDDDDIKGTPDEYYSLCEYDFWDNRDPQVDPNWELQIFYEV